MNYSSIFLVLSYMFCNLVKKGLSINSPGNNGIKSVQIQIPPYRNPGDTALLECEYDLGNDTLYSVKWYKEHEEFFRFLPKARPQINAYLVEGVKVDISKSDRNTVVINPVTWETSGLYRCEVSAEAPSFSSAQSEGVMEVIALPQENPTITGIEKQYQVGDKINLNCTSGKSYPPSILHWYINEQQVVNPSVLKHYPPLRHNSGLYSCILGLQFTLNKRQFHRGSMKVKCISLVAPRIYYDKKETEKIMSNIPQNRRETLLLGEWTTIIQAPWHVNSCSIYRSKLYYVHYFLIVLCTQLK